MPLENDTIRWIEADWPLAPTVRAFTTLRPGGASTGRYAGLNLGDHVGDDPGAVARNRLALRRAAALPSEPLWLRQVHGTRVIDARDWAPGVEADAIHCRDPGTVCVVLTADCLPVVLGDRTGTRVAAVHAGWRGLLDGVIEAAIDAMGVAPQGLLAWIGPAIGADAYAVGPEFEARFVARLPGAASFLRGEGGRRTADLAGLARLRLRAMGVGDVFGGRWCTHSDPESFYSYRREGVTGRMATLVWIARSPGRRVRPPAGGQSGVE